MLDFPRWKKIWLWGLTLIVMLAALPSLFSTANLTWPEALPNPTVNLGLDLAGGSHILLEADPSQVAAQRLENMEESVRAAMRLAEPRIRIGDVSTRDGRLSFMLDDSSQVDMARELMLPMANGDGLIREWDIAVVDESRFILTPTAQGIENAVTNAMDSATEVVRKRIDSLGTREPTIIRQGDDRIVVQVPGLQDPEQLKELLGQTAKLEFKLVDQTALPADVMQGIAPPGSQIVPYAAGSDFPGQSLAVKRLGGIKGDSLVDARQSFEQQTNDPVVSIQFDQQGGAKFATLTSENVNKPFAIILGRRSVVSP